MARRGPTSAVGVLRYRHGDSKRERRAARFPFLEPKSVALQGKRLSHQSAPVRSNPAESVSDWRARLARTAA